MELRRRSKDALEGRRISICLDFCTNLPKEDKTVVIATCHKQAFVPSGGVAMTYRSCSCYPYLPLSSSTLLSRDST